MAKRRNKRRNRSELRTEAPLQSLPADDELAIETKARYSQWLIVSLLLLFGAYQAIIYYQHQPVPTSDFPAFTGTTRPLLNFELPRTFKRVPMLGLMHITLGTICPGPHPELTAGWILNGALHAFSVLLLYRVGKHLLGEHAFYFAVLASINPWLLSLTYDPIAETAIVFFTLLTLDFLLRRSRWCYLFAMMASMVRYECAMLIPIAFCVDMVLCKPKKEKLRALIYAFLASVPMGLWLLATWLNWKPGSHHYVGHFVHERPRVGLKYWGLLWDTTFGPLVQIPSYIAAVFGKLKITSQQQADNLRQAVKALGTVIRIVTGLGFVIALVVAAIRKNWKFWALFGFWVAYVGIHSIRHATLDRYTIPAMWLTLLVAWYGLQSLGRLIAEKATVPRFVTVIIQVVVTLICGIWIAKLTTTLPVTMSKSKDSISLVYVSVSVVLIFLLLRWWVQQKHDIFKSVACLSVCSLLLISNQFQVVRIVGNGGKDGEFRMLAEWYAENAQPGERLLTTMTGVVRLFIPDHKENILFTGSGKVTTFPEFAKDCYKRNITYVAWDSRLGLTPHDSYYKAWNLQKIAPLAQAKDVGPFQFVERIYRHERRYLHVFKLQPLSTLPAAIQQQLAEQPAMTQP
ncbi:MAG: hypothetical protein ACYSUG_00480 [Planctomycetota bacterium]